MENPRWRISQETDFITRQKSVDELYKYSEEDFTDCFDFYAEKTRVNEYTYEQ